MCLDLYRTYFVVTPCARLDLIVAPDPPNARRVRLLLDRLEPRLSLFESFSGRPQLTRTVLVQTIHRSIDRTSLPRSL